MTHAELVAHVATLNPNDHYVVAIWSSTDVMDAAREDGKEADITQANANDIIENIDRHQDCTIGITWDTIESGIDDFLAA